MTLPFTLTRPGDLPEAAEAPHSVTLALGSSVMTLDGELPVEHLAPGDRVVTRSGACRIAAVDCAEPEERLMARLPGSMALLDAGQPVLVRDAARRAALGLSGMTATAGRLAASGEGRLERLAGARLFRLTFAAPVVLYANGVEAASQAA